MSLRVMTIRVLPFVPFVPFVLLVQLCFLNSFSLCLSCSSSLLSLIYPYLFFNLSHLIFPLLDLMSYLDFLQLILWSK